MRRFFIALFIITILGIQAVAMAAGGSISGTVTDAQSGDPLIGANVIVATTSLGAATDVDGHFTIKNVPAGTYTLNVTFIGYQAKQVEGVQVQDGLQTKVTIQMASAAVEGETVVVEEEADRNSVSRIVMEQRNSSNIQDAVSADQIARAGDSDAADALKRVTGVSVMANNQVYIRGLGDRYSQTQMNGVPVPSPDPEKKTVPLDLFSSSLIESITAAKTFTPDLPGVFAGGSVNIKTKAYPDNRVLNLSVGTKYDAYGVPDVHFLTAEHGKYDYWGFDDGTRAMPKDIPADIRLGKFNNQLKADYQDRLAFLGHLGREFKTDFQVHNTQLSAPVSLGFNYGDRFNPSRNVEYGFFSNVKFSNNYGYDEILNREYSLTTDRSLEAQKDMTSRKSGYNTNLGVTLSTGLTLFNSQKIKLQNIYTHGSENTVRLTQGFADNIDDGVFLKQYYGEKSLNTTTLSGTHDFHAFLKQHLEWSATTGISHLNEPDVNRLNYRLREERDVPVYQMDVFSWSAGAREFTSGYDRNLNLDLNDEFSFSDAHNAEYKVKVGLRSQGKSREFSKRAFYHDYSTGGFPSSVSEIPGPEQVGAGLTDDNFYRIDDSGTVHQGLFIAENTKGSDAYSAGERLQAQYAMVDVPLGLSLLPALNNIRFIGGVRREAYHLDLRPFDPVTGTPYSSTITNGNPIESNIDEVRYLPSLNLIANLTTNTNLRLSHSQTIARPEFREIAPFEFQTFYGDAVQVGYPFLKTTTIRNYDVRYEWFPSAAEMVSVSLFTKQFTNPIETSLVQTADRTYRTPQNALSAFTRGVEVETRKHLNFIPMELGRVNLHLNATYLRSQVKTDSTVTLFNGHVTHNSASTRNRPLEGQSNYLFNASLEYNNLRGLVVTAAFNTFGKRLISLGTAGLPNIYEYPFNALNLTASKALGHFKVGLKIKNLLDARHRFGQVDPAEHILKLTEAYRPGRSVSLDITYHL